MSNAGQAVLTVVGTVVGAYFGYPQLGLVLGELAGQALFPTKLPGVTGPKLSDRNTTTAQVGDPVPWIFGDNFSGGEVIFLDEIETVTNTQHQGKGGPSQDFTTFTYFQSIGLGICGTYPTFAGGPGTKTLLRVWENGKLVYDVRPQQTDETDEQFDARIQMSALYAETFVFYNGSETQLPDPTIEAVRGVGNTPAFRGLCWIMYPRRQLLDSQAQRHPGFRFEVGSCSTDFETLKLYTSSDTWHKPFGLFSVTPTCIGGGGGGQGGSNQLPEGVGLAVGGTGGGGGGAGRDTFLASELSDTVPITVGFGGQGGQPNPSPLAYGLPGEDGDDTTFGGLVTGGGGHGGANLDPGGRGGLGNLANGGDAGIGTINGGPGTDTNAPPNEVHHYGSPAGAGGGGGGGGTQFGGGTGGDGGDGEADPNPENPPGAQGGLGGTPGDGQHDPLILAGPGFAGHASLIHHGGGGGGGGGGCRGGDGNKGGPGGLYGGGGGGGGGSTIDGFGDEGGPGAKGICYLVQEFGADPCAEINKLSTWIAAICERVGLTDIETSTIDTIEAKGYALANQLSARAAIDPLRSVGWFDVVESGRVMKFIRRGGPIVATLEPDDLGAHEFGAKPGPAITTKKSQDVEMPRVLRVHYFAISRDYELGEAASPNRISTRASNEIDIELPVVLTDQAAMEIAEALWADMWAGRYDHETQVARPWIWLEGTDPIRVPVDGVYQRMRIVTIADQSVMLRKLTLVRDDDDAYVPVAVAVTPERPPTVIALKAPTILVVLDTPPLRPEDDDPGIYAAVAPQNSAQWAGAVIFRSCDEGVTWTPLTDLLLETLMGTLIEPLGTTTQTSIPDESLTLRVDFAHGQPESVTFDQMLAGANAAAIGAPGRWEIVSFQTATQTGATSWDLTKLLRGRRGTEHLIGTSQVGDRFVLLDENTLTRLAVTEDQIGDTCTYRPVTSGTTFESGADAELDATHEGVALLPFSPVGLEAIRELNGDITLTWTRRDRIGQTLPPDGIFPMSETTEDYELEVVLAFTSTVKRTLSALSSPTATYTQAQQAADGIDGLALDDLGFRVYQVSSVVGRGTPALLRAPST